MSVAFVNNYTCDGCGKQSPGATASAYSPPPVGWMWGPSAEGPHACGQRCWWFVAGVHRSRTGQDLEATTHDSVEEVEVDEEEAQPTALAVLPKNAPAPVPEAKPAAKAKPAPSRRHVIEAEVVEEEDGPSARVVPLGGEGACVQCGGPMPPRGPGRFPRTKCYGCQPKAKKRA